MYSETTYSIKVTVQPEFQDSMSSPGNNIYVWTYLVNIENFGNETIQLLNRHWRIIDAVGHVEEVKGKGVVGQQPTLRPNEAFEYSSQTYLTTTSGIMMGTYEMLSEDSRAIFDIVIPAFSLDVPYDKPRAN
jgi:ApaG protein